MILRTLCAFMNEHVLREKTFKYQELKKEKFRL